jgi:hypothetical protein
LMRNDGVTFDVSGFTSTGSTSIIVPGTGFLSTLRTGSSNVASSAYSIALGSSNTVTHGSNANVNGGSNNTITGAVSQPAWSNINGGFSNTLGDGSQLAVIGGGQCNTLFEGPGAIVNGGCKNVISAPFGTSGTLFAIIGGGVCNSILNSSGQAFIGSGGNNTINNSAGGSILGGAGNTVINNAGQSSVISGQYNLVNCSLGSSILTGDRNTILRNGPFNVFQSAIAGGSCNTITLGCSFVGSGFKNTIVGTTISCSSTILGGNCNTLFGATESSIIGGSFNVTYVDKTFIVGSNITADRSCTTFVNNLSIKNIPTTASGLPSGSVWRCTTDNTLRIVP